MVKQRFLACAVFLVCLAAAGAQQITRVAVVDMQKLYLTYYKDSAAVRAFEDEKSRVNEEINRMKDEIRALQSKKLDAQKQNDAALVQSLDADLYKKAQFLADYAKVKKAALDEKAQELSKSDAFTTQALSTIQAVAEKEGYSMVISSRSTDSVGSAIVWYNSLIDITDKVIQVLFQGRVSN